MKPSDKLFWCLLVLGIGLRCVALNRPLVDHGLLRQTQTAAATRGLIEQPGFALSSPIPWLGNLDTRFVLELPLYNYLVRPVHRITGNLDASGKLVSVALWAVGFLVLQGIWRRCLTPPQTSWANLLFVIAPLGVFYGQAFMPETLVQVIAFGFVLLTIRYDENPTLGRWSVCAAVGLLGLLIKLPEIAHLYVILAFMVLHRETWRALSRPRYWIAAAITIVALKGWSSYMDSVNTADLPEWGSKANLRLFIGPLAIRFHFKPWGMIALYLGAFVLPGLAAPATAYGFWVFLRRHRQRILALWLLSLVLFYLLWLGNTAATQSYYNLVAMAPLSALFGIGITGWLGQRQALRWPRAATILVVLMVVLPAVPIAQYLFKQDRHILAAAVWARDHTRPTDVILFRPNHRWEMIDYPFNAVFAYYSRRPTFVWTVNTPEPYRRAALERARYAVVTLPQPPPSGLAGMVYRFRGASYFQPQPVDWIEASGFEVVAREEGFIVYRRN